MIRKDSEKIIFSIWKSLFLSLLSLALFATSTFAYFKNTYSYPAGVISTGEFDSDQIKDGDDDSTPNLLSSPGPLIDLASNNNEQQVDDVNEDVVNENQEEEGIDAVQQDPVEEEIPDQDLETESQENEIVREDNPFEDNEEDSDGNEEQ